MSDEELIKAALLIEKEEGCIAWYKVSELAKQAENEKTRTLLEDMSKRMYHIHVLYLLLGICKNYGIWKQNLNQMVNCR